MKKHSTKNKDAIGVLIPTVPKANMFLNLVIVASSIFENIYVVAANANPENYSKAQVYSVEHETGANVFTRITNYIQLQIKIAWKLLQLRNRTNTWIFFLGGEVLLLPMVTAKLLNKNVVLLLGGNIRKEGEMKKDILFIFLRPLLRITLALSDRVVVYSPNLIKEWRLEKYRNKNLIGHEHFIDFDCFKTKKKFDCRDNLVGYVGRLSAEKGTINFIKAILEILKKRHDLKFLIGGDGQSYSEIMRFADTNNLNEKVKLPGWIPHDELPNHLNELKLIVIPSYTEGLPNLMLEAMACGTPVLATPVGAIPDIIKDGETGFIMENNSPECIAENVMRALEHPDLEKIVENARALVEREFTHEATVERWKEILQSEI